MLILARALGFMAPVAIAALLTIAVAVAAQIAPEHRPSFIIVLLAAAIAGMSTMGLFAWSYMRAFPASDGSPKRSTPRRVPSCRPRLGPPTTA